MFARKKKKVHSDNVFDNQQKKSNPLGLESGTRMRQDDESDQDQRLATSSWRRIKKKKKQIMHKSSIIQLRTNCIKRKSVSGGVMGIKPASALFPLFLMKNTSSLYQTESPYIRETETASDEKVQVTEIQNSVETRHKESRCLA